MGLGICSVNYRKVFSMKKQIYLNLCSLYLHNLVMAYGYLTLSKTKILSYRHKMDWCWFLKYVNILFEKTISSNTFHSIWWRFFLVFRFNEPKQLCAGWYWRRKWQTSCDSAQRSAQNATAIHNKQIQFISKWSNTIE